MKEQERKVEQLSEELNQHLQESEPQKQEPLPSDCDVLLVDVPHIFWSSWHASAAEDVSRSFTDTIERLDRLRKGIPHKHLAICIDWPPYTRHGIYSEYKRHRVTPSEHAVEQFRRIRQKMADDGLTVWGKKGFEADDIIATACRIAVDRGLSVTVASGDKDLMQLVQGNEGTVRLYDVRSGEVYGPREVEERYGVPPEKIRDFLVLTGDESDNIPGVKNIGPKRAAWLIQNFGGVNAAVIAAKAYDHRIQAAMSEWLRKHEHFELAWALVTLRSDAPIDFESLFREEPKPQPKSEPRAAPRKGSTKVIQPGKMSLSNVTRGPIQTPYEIILYGPEGVGKSSFVAGAPNPIFFDLERGTDELDVQRMPHAETWADLREGLNLLKKEQHEFKTVAIDTLDELETIIHDAVCRQHKQNSIEDFGYGKGHKYALDYWRVLFQDLAELREKGMHVVLLAHSLVQRFANPEGDDYDRFQLKLAPKAESYVKKQVKAVLFTNYVTYTKKVDGKVKAFGEGARVIYTEHRPSWDAKNRYQLPFEIPLNWDDFDTAARNGASVEALRERIFSLMSEADDQIKHRASEHIQRAGDDPRKLSQLADWLSNKLQGAAA